jgi:uncharacterized membrane protein YdbT with pleckstrin-like domain
MELHSGEQIVFEGHPSWRGILSFYIKGALIGLVAGAIVYFAVSTLAGIGTFAGIFGISVLVGFVKRISTRYVITTERLHIHRGIISKRVQQTNIDRVQNVNTNQSVFDRMLRVGKVDFDTAGTDDSDFSFADVADPDEVVAAVDRAQRATPGEGRGL